MALIGKDIEKAKTLLAQDEVVGIPTETVYGLAGNALSEHAILKIFEVKNRPKFDPLIAHTDSFVKVKELVEDVPQQAEQLAKHFWPGPLTLLLEKKEHVPDLLTSGHPRVAVRIPSHPVTLQLLNSVDFPLAAPSANPFGYVSPTKAHHVSAQLGHKLEYVLDGGNCSVGVESTIVGFENGVPTVHRLGGISLESLEEVVGKVKLELNTSSNPAAPGMLKSHYSPGRKLVLGDIEGNLKSRDPAVTGVISFATTYDLPDENLFVLSEKGDVNEAAKNLFHALRSMDRPHIKEVLSERVPEHGLGRAINDRLRRASARG